MVRLRDLVVAAALLAVAIGTWAHSVFVPVAPASGSNRSASSTTGPASSRSPTTAGPAPTTSTTSTGSTASTTPTTSTTSTATPDGSATTGGRALAAGPITDNEEVKPVLVGGTDVEATRRGLNALSTIAYDWQAHLPGWEIRFHAATSGAFGYTLTAEHRIDIYVRSNEPGELLAHVIAHELGHAVDVTLNDTADRQRWLDLRGIDAPWWPDNRAADFATGAGDFAESFAAWQVGDGAFRSQLGTPPSADQRAVLATLAQA